MTEIEEEQEEIAAVSEQQESDQQDSSQEEQKMVPLAALQAERRKRQEYESRNKVYEDILTKTQLPNQHQQEEEEEEEDPESLITRSSYKQDRALSKREILEQVYQDMNPKAVQKINTYLKPILDKKPWLAATLDNAQNRLSRANEIVDDYMHLIDERPRSSTAVTDARRMVDNANKPRSPSETGKSAQPSGTEYLKSIQGKKEFREYRQKVLRGEV